MAHRTGARDVAPHSFWVRSERTSWLVRSLAALGGPLGAFSVGPNGLTPQGTLGARENAKKKRICVARPGEREMEGVPMNVAGKLPRGFGPGTQSGHILP